MKFGGTKVLRKRCKEIQREQQLVRTLYSELRVSYTTGEFDQVSSSLEQTRSIHFCW